jgi:CubicO group peptidase (beta-lactamase class C family)
MIFLSQRRAECFARTASILAGAWVALAALTAHAAAADDSAIERVMTAFVKPGEPGCTVGVLQDGRLAHALAFGLADVERRKPLDTHSIFDLASVSKQFTAFAILLLEKDGKLSLDDPIVRYLPELEASAKGVSLRHLLHHTGGLRDYIGIIYMGGRRDADGSTIHESIQALARQTRPNEQPGVEYEYSNTGYLLLGVVIARVSGQTFAGFLDERIFRPLGMKNTQVVDSYPDTRAARARGYAQTERGFEIDETAWEQVGDGGVHSDIHDLALWDENFYAGRLGGRELIAKMVEVGVLNSGERIDYAAGLRVATTRGLPTVSHGGSWVGYRSQILRFPQEHLSVIVLCNRGDADSGALATAVAAVFLGDKMGPPQERRERDPAGAPELESEEPESPEKAAASTWRPSDLAPYVGNYFSVEANAYCRLYLQREALVLEGCAGGEILKPGKPGEFVDLDDSLSLRFPESGKGFDGFTYDTFGLRGLPFERVQEASE